MGPETKPRKRYRNSTVVDHFVIVEETYRSGRPFSMPKQVVEWVEAAQKIAEEVRK